MQRRIVSKTLMFTFLIITILYFPIITESFNIDLSSSVLVAQYSPSDLTYNNLQKYDDYQIMKKYPANQGHMRNQKEVNIPSPLLRQALTSSIGALFIFLTWRTITVYELADQFSSATLRYLSVAPTMLLFCANITGFILNCTRPLNFKTLLKSILAMNVVREIVEVMYSTTMLLLNTQSSAIPREAYFGRLLSNAWFIFICLSFSKSRWVLQTTQPTGKYATPPQ